MITWEELAAVARGEVFMNPTDARHAGYRLRGIPVVEDARIRRGEAFLISQDITFNPPDIEDLRASGSLFGIEASAYGPWADSADISDFLGAARPGENVRITNISTDEKVQDMNCNGYQHEAREVPTKPLTTAGTKRVTAALNALEALTIEDTFPAHASENCRSAVRSLRVVLDDDARRAAYAKAQEQEKREIAKRAARREREMSLRQKHEKQCRDLLQKQRQESAAVLENLG